MIGCPSCSRSIPRDAIVCPYCTQKIGETPAVVPVVSPRPRWGHILLVLAVLGWIAGWLIFSPSGPRGAFLAFDKQRDDWHRRCDIYIGKPVTTPAARECVREMEEMTAYAKRQGW
jgi:hypothetical protein